jgi:hypothetical protein
MDMVVIDTVGSRFEADLLAAKLGANGVLWQLRSNYPGAYTGERPFGGIDILVPVEEVDEARAVISADGEVMPDVVFEGQDPADFETAPDRATPITMWVTGVRVVAIGIAALLVIGALDVLIQSTR